MAKVGLNKLGLVKNTEQVDFMWKGQKIEVIQYLPLEKKLEIISNIINESVDLKGYYAPYRLDLFMTIAVVQNYTNISFTDKQKENEPKLYDTLASNGVIAAILELIPNEEYNELMTYMKELIQVKTTFNNSAAGLVNQVLVDLPKNAEKAAEVLNSFNVEDYKEVIEFAKAANGNRPVPVEG